MTQARHWRVWSKMVAWQERRPRRTSRIKAFADRVRWLGPVVWMLSVSYFVTQIVVSLAWKPRYSWFTNSISDLGNTHCNPARLCSPRHDWMNAQFIVLGGVMALGSLLIFQEFQEKGAEERLAALIGFGGMAIAGVGAALVGRFPENTVGWMHILGAGLAIGVGSLAIFVLGVVLPLPERLRWPMRIVSPIALVALALFASHHYLGIGGGTMERIAAYPETIWLISFGVYISASHYAARRAERT
jgi:hypothetical membrane protein